MREIRLINESKEFRAYEENGKRFIGGYASVFDSKSRMIFELKDGKIISYYEYIERGAFDNVLEDNVIMNINHDDNKMLGRRKSGTLQLEVDDIGLKFRVELPNTTLGNDVWELVRRGDYSECSFAFSIEKDRVEKSIDRFDNTPLRYIEKVKRLFDVSIVTNGAYGETSISTDVEYVERMINDLDVSLLNKEEGNKEENKEKELEEKRKIEIDILKEKNRILKLRVN